MSFQGISHSDFAIVYKMSCFIVWRERGVPKDTLNHLYHVVMSKNGRTR